MMLDRKLVILVLIIIVSVFGYLVFRSFRSTLPSTKVSVGTKTTLTPATINISPLEKYKEPEFCNEFDKSYQAQFNQLNFQCQTGTDCILDLKSSGCGTCVNKNEKQSNLEKLGNIYNTGVAKGCLPQIQCRQLFCSCLNSKCIKQYK